MLRYLGALTEVQCIVAALVLPKSKTNFGKGGGKSKISKFKLGAENLWFGELLLPWYPPGGVWSRRQSSMRRYLLRGGYALGLAGTGISQYSIRETTGRIIRKKAK